MATYSNIPPRAAYLLLSGDAASVSMPIDGERWHMWRWVFRTREDAGGAVDIWLRPNGVTTNMASTFRKNMTPGTSASEIVIGSTDGTRRATSEGVIWTRTGLGRQVRAWGGRAGLDFFRGGGGWDDDSTPITSLEFRLSGGNLLGSSSATQVWVWPVLVGYREKPPVWSFSG